MPPTIFPPTPISSTDIKSVDGTERLDALQMAFMLPESAIATDHPGQNQLTPTEETALPEHHMYTSPSETVKSRRRSSAAQPPNDQFALPPPPARSHKIIQMRPRRQEDTSSSNAASRALLLKAPSDAASGPDAIPTTPAGNKKKRPSSTTAAGRKIARKTAHSLIERRRRSKMNEEFALLKSMVPACSGEMHKLSILQATIEYVRYLEDCVAKLKARKNADLGDGNEPSRYPDEPFHPHLDSPDRDEEEPDVEMAGSETPSPALTATHSRPQQPSVSPVLMAQVEQARHDSHSPDYRRYEHSASSASVSPAFGPQAYHHYAHSLHSAPSSTQTSPALVPRRDMDEEASAVLLMLNQSDRRGTGRGMSVRDLLSN